MYFLISRWIGSDGWGWMDIFSLDNFKIAIIQIDQSRQHNINANRLVNSQHYFQYALRQLRICQISYLHPELPYKLLQMSWLTNFIVAIGPKQAHPVRPRSCPWSHWLCSLWASYHGIDQELQGQACQEALQEESECCVNRRLTVWDMFTHSIFSSLEHSFALRRRSRNSPTLLLSSAVIKLLHP